MLACTDSRAWDQKWPSSELGSFRNSIYIIEHFEIYSDLNSLTFDLKIQKNDFTFLSLNPIFSLRFFFFSSLSSSSDSLLSSSSSLSDFSFKVSSVFGSKVFSFVLIFASASTFGAGKSSRLSRSKRLKIIEEKNHH